MRSIAVQHAGRPDRGAITVWANQDLTGIEISDCAISYNDGRGVWFDGPITKSIHDISIKNNQLIGNEGSGVLLILANGGEVRGNTFEQNCHSAIEPWQAAIRLWSAGVSNLAICNNTIADQRWGHDRDSSIGIHCDETGDCVIIGSNQIRDVDNAGIEVENCRGVIVENNTVNDSNIGIMLNRAGHDHIVRGNTVANSRSQGISMQGWLAHGIDAQPELLVQGRLFTHNLIEDNAVKGSRWGNLKAVGGAEQVDQPLGDIFQHNDFGPERPGFIEWGDRTLDRYDQWPASASNKPGSEK